MEEKLLEVINQFDNFTVIDFTNDKEEESIDEKNINIQFRFSKFKNIAYIDKYMDAQIDILFNIFQDTNLDICFRKSDKVTEDLIKIIVEKINSFAQLKESETTIWNTNFSHYKFVKSN